MKLIDIHDINNELFEIIGKLKENLNSILTIIDSNEINPYFIKDYTNFSLDNIKEMELIFSKIKNFLDYRYDAHAMKNFRDFYEEIFTSIEKFHEHGLKYI